MYKKILFVLIVLISCKEKSPLKDTSTINTPFEISKGNETATYSEIISFYNELAKSSNKISIQSFGMTDSGNPLHLVIFNNAENFEINQISQSKKTIVLINNGIHPGEPDGIDASMLLLKNLTKNFSSKDLSNLILVVIPVYNIGGALNRNKFTRVNQNGPNSYGFRGNARNFDLNRDFIKADTKNAQTFANLYTTLNPDIFVDTHVSNGADYQYSITHLFTQHNKLGKSLGEFLEQKMRPFVENDLKEKNIEITPYVNVWGATPENGFSQFFDSPRYSTGYATLFNSLSLMIETHMLKPFKKRVLNTYDLLNSIIKFGVKNGTIIKDLRQKNLNTFLESKIYPVQYKLNDSVYQNLEFKGFEASIIPSKVTNGKRLYYDENKPFTKIIKYFNNFKPSKYVKIPKYYILRKGWWKVINRLNENHIKYKTLKKDTLIKVQVQKIASYETVKKPFEGHYFHFNTQVKKSIENIIFKKGDILISTNQKNIRYLLETLEPEAVDSFFNWNYFDTVLQQKEGYSPYVFEDLAENLLKENNKLKQIFEQKLKTDIKFKNNPIKQLRFIYNHSKYHEKAYLTLPIYKLF